MSRQTNLTPEVQEKVLEALRKGNYRVIAAQYAGIGEQTFKDWMRRGIDEPESIYAAFRTAVLETEARVEMEGAGVISDASAKDPKRLLEFLARKFPERWSTDNARMRRLEIQLLELKSLVRELLREDGEGRSEYASGSSETQSETDQTG